MKTFCAIVEDVFRGSRGVPSVPFEPTLNKNEQYTTQNPTPAEEHVPPIGDNVIKNISHQECTAEYLAQPH